MKERTRWGDTYHVSPRRTTPEYDDDDGVCKKCGRKRYKCGVSDCVRHFHNVEIR